MPPIRTPDFELNAMNITMTGHEATKGRNHESHRFQFVADDGDPPPRSAFVTLATARVFVRELANHSTLDAMMRSIVGAAMHEYATKMQAK